MKVNINFDELESFKKGLLKKDMNKICSNVKSDLVRRFLRQVKLVSPVDTGELRRSWKSKYISPLESEIYNDKNYASYVEYGHRTRGGRGWIKGQYFMTWTEEQLEKIAPQVVDQYLEEAMKT